MKDDGELIPLLTEAWERAADNWEKPVNVTVGDRLHARLGHAEDGRARLAVWRTGGQATEAEADALATISGMEHWKTRAEGRFWIAEEVSAAPLYHPDPDPTPDPTPDLPPPWEAQEPPAPPAADPTPSPTPTRPLSGAVCGTCGHGRMDAYGDIECLLGWQEHDPYMTTSYPHPTETKRDGKPKWITEQVTFAHPGVPLPLMSPRCRCMCRTDRWTHKRAPA